MSETTFEEYKQLVQEQGQALLEVMQSVALGDLNVEFEIQSVIDGGTIKAAKWLD